MTLPTIVPYLCAPCPQCHEASLVRVPMTALLRWRRDGLLIQSAFPELSADERELLQTGTHGKCFDEMFGEAK